MKKANSEFRQPKAGRAVDLHSGGQKVETKMPYLNVKSWLSGIFIWRIFVFLICVFVLILSIGYLVSSIQVGRAWTEPTAGPPNDNVFPPINIGGYPQYKVGHIAIGTSSVNETYQILSSGDADSERAYVLVKGSGNPIGNAAGIFQGGSNDLRFWVNSDTRMLINSSGNVGIGTINPQTKIDVYDNTTGPLLSMRGLDTNYRGMKIADTSNSEKWFVGNNASNNFVIRNAGATDYLTILNSNGNVGIGTTNPQDLLHVYNGNISLTDSGNIANTYRIKSAQWQSVGSAGSSHVHSMAVFDNNLYAGNYDGHIYRYDGGTTWTDVSPYIGPEEYWVQALAVYGGKLYAGRVWGEVWRYDGGTTWTKVTPAGGMGGDVQQVESLVVYNNSLYASKAGGHVYRYDGGTTWTDMGDVGTGDTLALIVYDGKLYAANSDASIYYYNGKGWTSVGTLPYSVTKNGMTVYDGHLYALIGTNYVYRYDPEYGSTTWTSIGRPSTGSPALWSKLIVYNGSLYAGINDGYVYRYDGGTTWTNVGGGTSTMAMAVYNGQIYIGKSGGAVYRFTDWLPGQQLVSVGDDRSIQSPEMTTTHLLVRGMAEFGSEATILKSATDNLIYGNIGDNSVSGSHLLLLQRGSTDKFSIDKEGQVYAAGNVGIGTTGPNYKLDVRGTGAAGQINAQAGLCIDGDCKTSWDQIGGYWSANGNDIYNNNSGNVGIGVTNPATKLEVRDTSSGKRIRIDPSNFRIYSQGDITICTPIEISGGPGTCQVSHVILDPLSLGNIGISTTAPSYKLDVYTSSGEANVGVRSTADTASIYLKSGSGAASQIRQTLNQSELRFWVNGQDRMIINSSGNVGIETNNPQQKFQVNNTEETAFVVTSNGNVGVSITDPVAKLTVLKESGLCPGQTTILGHFGTTALSNQNAIALSAVSSGIKTCPAYPLGRIGLYAFGDEYNAYFAAPTRTYFNGNVGIGTTDPQVKLHIKDTAEAGTANILIESAQPQINFGSDNMTKILESGDTLYFATGNDFRMVIESGGNVGIGTTGPKYKLDVRGTGAAGQINAQAGLCINGDCKTSWDQIGGYWSANGNDIYNNNSGNVGIGINNPGSKLQVNGNAVIGYSASRVGPANGLAVFGNVGIGVTTPQSGAKLDVNGDIYLGANDYAGIALKGGGGSPVIEDDCRNAVCVDTTLTIRANNGPGSNHIVLDPVAGGVGIGVTNPEYKLQVSGNIAVQGSGKGYYFLQDDAAQRAYITHYDLNQQLTIATKLANGYIQFKTGAESDAMRITNTGNVGIGTTGPNYKLDVRGTGAAGQINAQAGLCIDGDCKTSWDQ
ncbi:MAG: hypothetical protein ABIK19_01355, partial [candidate division WOR-3 bacterium]